jgi:hypothetical protein
MTIYLRDEYGNRCDEIRIPSTAIIAEMIEREQTYMSKTLIVFEDGKINMINCLKTEKNCYCEEYKLTTSEACEIIRYGTVLLQKGRIGMVLDPLAHKICHL